MPLRSFLILGLLQLVLLKMKSVVVTNAYPRRSVEISASWSAWPLATVASSAMVQRQQVEAVLQLPQPQPPAREQQQL
jgi:hypothetical protein